MKLPDIQISPQCANSGTVLNRKNVKYRYTITSISENSCFLMHVIPPYKSTITLFRVDGEISVFPSLRAALKALGFAWIRDNVGEHFCSYLYAENRFDRHLNLLGSEPVYAKHRYIMRDDEGQIVTSETFRPLLRRNRYFFPMQLWKGKGPVPGTACVKAGAHYYRRIRTFNELRQAALVLHEEGEVAPRGARNLRNLPTVWDDPLVHSRYNHNWKRYRRTRWKEPRQT